MASSLRGRVALVTGAGRGIGRAVAHELAREGASVVVNDIGRADDGQPTADLVVSELRGLGAQAIASTESIVETAAAERIVEQAITAFGRLDVLVNNAGLSARGAIWDVDRAEFDRITAAHVTGSFHCTKAALEPMRAAGFGRIVNLVSRSGIIGIPDSFAYGVGKGAVFGLTNALSRDLRGTGITVNGVCPSSTRTEMVVKAIDELRASGPEGAQRADSLLAQMQTPEEVARPIAALCTEAAGAINGQFFLVSRESVGLYQPLTLSESLERDASWAADDLGRAIAAMKLYPLDDPYAGKAS